MNPPHSNQSRLVPGPSLIHAISELAREASIELNVQDARHLDASRALLVPGKRIYVSFLPKQDWRETEAACSAVRAAGFEPVPHLPVRLIPDQATLERTLAVLVGTAQVKEVLLIAGDYAVTAGPYACVADVLRAGVLERAGLTRVSLAGHPEGHPEGHPTITLDEIRRAEREKVLLAADAGLTARLLTQFFFESAPFIEWVRQLRCGAGPSIRALGARPGSFARLIGDQGPENIVRSLVQARLRGEADFSGIHLFCVGGYLRTCEWLHGIAEGRIRLTDADGFTQA